MCGDSFNVAVGIKTIDCLEDLMLGMCYNMDPCPASSRDRFGDGGGYSHFVVVNLAASMILRISSNNKRRNAISSTSSELNIELFILYKANEFFISNGKMFSLNKRNKGAHNITASISNGREKAVKLKDLCAAVMVLENCICLLSRGKKKTKS